jgi:hypothetical protein
MVSSLSSCGAAVKIQFEADFAMSPLAGGQRATQNYLRLT